MTVCRLTAKRRPRRRRVRSESTASFAAREIPAIVGVLRHPNYTGSKKGLDDGGGRPVFRQGGGRGLERAPVPVRQGRREVGGARTSPARRSQTAKSSKFKRSNRPTIDSIRYESTGRTKRPLRFATTTRNRENSRDSFIRKNPPIFPSPEIETGRRPPGRQRRSVVAEPRRSQERSVDSPGLFSRSSRSPEAENAPRRFPAEAGSCSPGPRRSARLISPVSRFLEISSRAWFRGAPRFRSQR